MPFVSLLSRRVVTTLKTVVLAVYAVYTKLLNISVRRTQRLIKNGRSVVRLISVHRCVKELKDENSEQHGENVRLRIYIFYNVAVKEKSTL